MGAITYVIVRVFIVPLPSSTSAGHGADCPVFRRQARCQHGAMPRRDLLPLLVALAAIAAVAAALLAFKVRVFLAGGRLVAALAVIIAVVWLLARAGSPRR